MSVAVAAVCLAVTVGASSAASGPASAPPRTPAGWAITPAGRQVDVLRFPLGLAPTADGRHVVVSSDSGGVQGLTVVDAQTMQAVPTPAANLFMGVAVTPGGQVWASGGNADRLFRWQLAGGIALPLDLSEATPVPVHNAMNGLLPRAGLPAQLPIGDGVSAPSYPGALLLSGNLLYAAGTLSEPSSAASPCPGTQPACAHVTIVDTASGKALARPAVGLDAFGMALDAARGRLYVSNWADQAGRGGPAGGTISVVDVSNPRAAHELGVVGVGHHPSAIQLSSDRRRLFVANTNDDTITVLDTSGPATPTVVSTESVAPAPGAQVGAHPVAFALSPDGGTLFVALAGMNAVEVRDGHTGAPLAGAPVYIPTGWYPAALAVTPATPDGGKYRLWVANAKGVGFGPGFNGSVLIQGTKSGGTVSAIDLPVSAKQANAWSAQVRSNDELQHLTADPCRPGPGVRVSQVLCPPSGKQSPIKHVVYIVTENKTFDQYFGDIGLVGAKHGYDADPTWLLYGQPVTPNHHALADRYSLGDRFFSDAEVSVTGHSWTSGAIATDHNERLWPADYDQGVRGTHGNGDPVKASPSGIQGAEIGAAEDVLNDPQGGYIFDAFKRAGAQPPSDTPAPLTMAIYGEHTAQSSGNMDAYKAQNWHQGELQVFDTCRALMFINGKAPDGPIPNDLPEGPSLNGKTSIRDCQGLALQPTFSLQHWEQVFGATGRDVMPNFSYLTLPVDHTLGTNLGSPTPASMVADNDNAIGLVVQALSKSPFWSSTAVVVTEDDTQLAGDHISPLRDYLLVASPWAAPGPDHQWGSMSSLLRTIEQIFSVEPVSLNDRLALPMHEAFLPKLSDRPDLGAYTSVRSLVPFAVNEPGAVGQALSMGMDWSKVDQIDEQTLNAILYAAGRGWPLDLTKPLTPPG